MKKLSILLVLVMALAFTFTSCKNVEKCWKVTVKVKYEGASEKEKFYVWGTENDLEMAIAEIKEEYEEIEEEYGYDIDVTYEKADKDESDCDDVDMDDLI
jgi:maltose-binding protein MalE